MLNFNSFEISLCKNNNNVSMVHIRNLLLSIKMPLKVACNQSESL